MPPKPSQPSATDASPSSIDSAAATRVQPTRPPSRTLVAAKESSLSLSVPHTGSKALVARRQRLAKEMAWWQFEVDDWFNTYLPGEDLPNNLKWTPFNVDLTSERTMYAGLREGLQDAIETAGCHELVARSTYRYPDNTCSSTGQTTRIFPDLGIYPASRPDPDVQQQSAATSVDPIESLRVRFASMEVPVEVKHETVKRATASSTGTPATDTPPSSSIPILPVSLPQVSEGDFSILSSEGGAAVPLGLKAHCGQMMDYVIELYNRQHRLFVFMILFVNERGRLLRFDRTGAAMMPEFDYTQRPEIVGKFLYRLSRNSDAMGHDPTATRANEADTTLFRKLHTHHHPQSTVARCLEDAAMDGWPVYKLSFEGCFSPAENRAVRRSAPISRREFLIGKPMSVSRSLSGRGTKAHVAYDIATKKVVVIKDSWRPNSRNIPSEYDTYLLLNDIERGSDEDDSLSIPTLLGGGDVVCQGVTQETRTSNLDLLTRIHFRLILKEVCRPLEDFADSLELVTAISFALEAHFIAWTAAHVLHRGVSVGNILILDEDPGGLPNRRTSKGLLGDWDLARMKDEMENPLFAQKTRSGTWPFVSARLQHIGREQLHELSDDLESFVHVLNYCAVKYLPNDLSDGSSNIIWFISDVYDYVREADGIEKGKPRAPFGSPASGALRLMLATLPPHPVPFAATPASHFSKGRQPAGLGPKTLMRIHQRSSVPEDDPPAPPMPVRAPPPADPAQSPLKDHTAMASAFARALLRTTGPGWPTDEKIARTKPLALLPAESHSGKRQSGAPPYAPYEDPKHSVPSAKRARTRRQ
ncbi:hypothetical protein LXA43DRAFT_1159135 [Ganoderma leucocontextum]|nr:hypothetical protein LXA43DRAFT_1159135 [Ganoderma leucocontextum]